MKKTVRQAAASESADDYEVYTCTPEDLTEEEMSACIDVIRKGEAVDLVSAQRELPRAHVLAVARRQKQIVAIGAIKRERPSYAAATSRSSGVVFPTSTLELGYVAVHPGHRGNRLSQRIVQSLLSQYAGRLFATTYNPYMKRTLEQAGFTRKGGEWKGRKHMLSLWEKL